MTEPSALTKPLYDTADAIRTALPNAVLAAQVVRDEIIITVRRETIVEVLIALRDDPRLSFSQLIDILGVDYPERAERFEIVYNLLSMNRNQRVRVKLTASEDTPVPSVCTVYACANWLEREV